MRARHQLRRRAPLFPHGLCDGLGAGGSDLYLEEGSEIYMATQKNTQKCKNVLGNPSVSLLIDTREDHQGPRRHEAKAMTVTGKCELVEDEAKKTFVKAKLLERHPHLKDFLNHPDGAILCVRVASFLLLDGLTDAHFEEI